MDKDVCAHRGILFSYKKEGNATTCDNLDGPWLSAISQTETSKYYMISLICRIFFKREKSKLVEREIRFVIPREKGVGEGKLDENGQKVQTSRLSGN